MWTWRWQVRLIDSNNLGPSSLTIFTNAVRGLLDCSASLAQKQVRILRVNECRVGAWVCQCYTAVAGGLIQDGAGFCSHLKLAVESNSNRSLVLKRTSVGNCTAFAW